MLTTARLAFGIVALGIAVAACSSGTVLSGPGAPQQQALVTSPTSGVQISATIAAVTLGDPCAVSSGTSSSPSVAACDAGASPPSTVDAGTDTSKSGSLIGNCGGTSFCQQSNVQISFTTTAGKTPVTVEVVSVALFDSATGAQVDTLTASHPQLWTGSAYGTWGQTLTPSSDLKASYDLTAPSWSTIDNGSSTRVGSSYSTKYKLEVTLRLDGVEIILVSTDLNREPVVST